MYVKEGKISTQALKQVCAQCVEFHLREAHVTGEVRRRWIGGGEVFVGQGEETGFYPKGSREPWRILSRGT